MNVTKLNGYNPAVGTTFAFLTAVSVTGTFANVSGGFAADYTANSATLRTVPFTGLTFDSWATAAGLSGANAAPTANPDGDLQANFDEYVFNTNPTASNPAPQNGSVVDVGGQKWLALEYRRWADREAAGVTYTPQTGDTLGAWSSAGIIEEIDPNAPVIPGSTACRCRVPLGDGKSQFLRVRVVK